MNENKKLHPEDSELGLAGLWTSGFLAMELFRQKHKCIQCCPIYNLKKKKTSKHIKI